MAATSRGAVRVVGVSEAGAAEGAGSGGDQPGAGGRVAVGAAGLGDAVRHEKWASEKAVRGLLAALEDVFGPIVQKGGQIDTEWIRQRVLEVMADAG